MIFKGRNRVRYNYARWGYTRNNGKTWHGGIDVEGLDDSTILMPFYDNKSISGTVVKSRIVNDHSNPTWEWGYYITVQLDNAQTPDPVNFITFAHCERLLVTTGTKVKSGDALAIMGNSGNAADANPPYKHCHFEVRNTASSKGLDPTHYVGFPNEVGTYGALDNDLDYTEYTGMSYLIPGEYRGTYEYFYGTDVNTSAGSLIKNGSYRLLGISKNQKGGFTWAKININGAVYYVALHDNYQAIQGPVLQSVLKEGIDVSKYQANCNYDAISKAGYKFVIIRVMGMKGTTPYIDEYFEQNYTNAKAAGLQVGAYFYTKSRSESDIKKEIDFFLPSLAGKKFEMPIYIDIEESSIYSTISKEINTEIVRSAAEYLLSKGYYPGWYTYRSFATNYLIPESLAKYTCWIAETGSSTPKYSGPYEMWQYNQVNGSGLVQSSALDVDKQYYDFRDHIVNSKLNGWTEDVNYTQTYEFVVDIKFSDGVNKDRGDVNLYLYNGFDVIGSCVCNYSNNYHASFGWYRIYGDDGLKRSYYITDSTGNESNLPLIENYTLSNVSKNAPDFTVTYLYNGKPESQPIEEVHKARFRLTGGTREEWNTYNPVLGKNELALDLSAHKFIVGDGKTGSKDLPYFSNDASTLEGYASSDFAKINDVPKKMSELEQDVTFRTTKEDLELENVTNDRQIVGIYGDITPGNILILADDGFHVQDSGININQLRELLK